MMNDPCANTIWSGIDIDTIPLFHRTCRCQSFGIRELLHCSTVMVHVHTAVHSLATKVSCMLLHVIQKALT